MLNDLANSLPPVITRKKIKKYFGEVVTPGALANADSRGTGPRVRYRVGRDIMYPTAYLLEWLESRSFIQFNNVEHPKDAPP